MKRLYQTGIGLILLIISLNLNGCAFRKLDTVIQLLNKQIALQQEQIDLLKAELGQKCSKGEMDAETCASFQIAVHRMNQQIDQWTRQVITLYQKNTPLAAPRLTKSAEAFVEAHRVKHEKYKQTLQAMFALVRDDSKMRPFETSAYYPPGKYEIPEENKGTLQQALKPTLDGILNFKQKYPDFPCQGKVEVNGYADRTGIGEGSALYNELKAALRVESPTRPELNRQLSQWRADGIGFMLKKMPASTDMQIVTVGKGELDPPGANLLPASQALKDNDSRRRIVVVYWGCPAKNIE